MYSGVPTGTARLGDLQRFRLHHVPGQTEIQQLGQLGAIFQQPDVARLDVPMHNAAFVSIDQGHGPRPRR